MVALYLIICPADLGEPEHPQSRVEPVIESLGLAEFFAEAPRVERLCGIPLCIEWEKLMLFRNIGYQACSRGIVHIYLQRNSLGTLHSTEESGLLFPNIGY